MALSIFEEAFARERTRQAPNRHGRRRTRYDRATQTSSLGTKQEADFVEAAARTLSAVQTVCDALIPPSQGRFTVAFGGRTAMTQLERKRISITPQPLYMKGLRLADVADTFTGFVVHEIGHVEISGDTDVAIEAWLKAEPGFERWRSTILRIANVLDDVALERWARSRFPGVAHTFRVTTKFVAQEGGLPTKPPRRWDPKAKYAERFNFAVVAVRYRWFTRWVGDPATRRERQWWTDWADRYGEPGDVDLRVQGVRLALERIAGKPEDRPEEPEPEQGEDEPEQGESEPESFDTGDEPEPGDDESDDDDAPTRGGKPSEDESEDDDAEGNEEPGDDEYEDEPDEPHEGYDDESEPEPGEDESEGTDGSGESDEAGDESDAEGDDLEPGIEDESDERPEGAHLDPMDEDDLGADGQDSSSPPVYDGYDPEDLRNTVQTVDDYLAERERFDQYRDDNLQKQVEVEMVSQKVTDSHGYGSMKVVIRL